MRGEGWLGWLGWIGENGRKGEREKGKGRRLNSVHFCNVNDYSHFVKLPCMTYIFLALRLPSKT